MKRNANPAPDLQALTSKHGGYDRIPPEAWAEHDRAMAEWHEWQKRRREYLESPSGEIPDRAAADRSASAVCPVL
jgi:hypothetical protein